MACSRAKVSSTAAATHLQPFPSGAALHASSFNLVTTIRRHTTCPGATGTGHIICWHDPLTLHPSCTAAAALPFTSTHRSADSRTAAKLPQTSSTHTSSTHSTSTHCPCNLTNSTTAHPFTHKQRKRAHSCIALGILCHVPKRTLQGRLLHTFSHNGHAVQEAGSFLQC